MIITAQTCSYCGLFAISFGTQKTCSFTHSGDCFSYNCYLGQVQWCQLMMSNVTGLQNQSGWSGFGRTSFLMKISCACTCPGASAPPSSVTINWLCVAISLDTEVVPSKPHQSLNFSFLKFSFGQRIK